MYVSVECRIPVASQEFHVSIRNFSVVYFEDGEVNDVCFDRRKSEVIILHPHIDTVNIFLQIHVDIL